ncbi:hypothetical protein Vretimale_3156 [Volvox reticuliferus]|uniref:RING-type domain-containing protein n=1 Tax=Volvox reticuliferus TaxID=1737510 RepID=A0A8J4DDR1_9CHLO|nr:hypothetical protein Vretifemale_6578 [Volvox reticuliferus]GIL97519.1 hypothetical protein Vretimale_3156 [Volvox reticuliferus]
MLEMDGGEALELHCPICYGEQGDSGFSTLICGHIFHEKCLTQSLRIKKECPSCRCPARPLDTGRGSSSNPKCPCKTGQPLRLFHLQRPRNGEDAAAAAFRGLAGASGAALDAAVLATAKQWMANREAQLQEAFREQRERAAELEVELEKKRAEVAKAQEKAERRKQRLAVMEKEHHLNTTRLTEDKLRLEVRERELTEELTRLRQALHGMRMDLDKARATVYERDEAVMRLKREVAIQRARAGGSAALQPREMAELLGERKEDWQAVYSIKVEELRRAMEVVAELRVELALSKTEGDTRVASERLAGAERLKAVAQERDDAKRELMELEYKLHEAQRQLNDLQSAAAVGPAPARPTHNTPFPAAAGANTAAAAAGLSSRAPDVPHKVAKPQQHHGSAFGFPSRLEVAENADTAANDCYDDDEGDLEALALEAMEDFESEAASDDDLAEEAVKKRQGNGQSGIAGASGSRKPPASTSAYGGRAATAGPMGEQDEDEVLDDNTPYDMAAEEAENAPPSKRQRQDDSCGGGGGNYGDFDGQACDNYELDDVEPVPQLPRFFSGRLITAASGPPQDQRSTGPRAGAGVAPGGAFGLSFASKMQPDASRWGQGRGSGAGLICEGPDGRGGTVRFPLTSSLLHNTGARKAAPGRAAGRGGGGRGRGGTGGPQGRIDAFLRPIPPSNRR